MISPLLASVSLHRFDRRWQTAGPGLLVRYADDLVVMCEHRRDAGRALAALTAIFAVMGLEPKPAKTRIVHLTEGGDGLDFLGFDRPRYWAPKFAGVSKGFWRSGGSRAGGRERAGVLDVGRFAS